MHSSTLYFHHKAMGHIDMEKNRSSQTSWKYLEGMEAHEDRGHCGRLYWAKAIGTLTPCTTVSKQSAFNHKTRDTMAVMTSYYMLQHLGISKVLENSFKGSRIHHNRSIASTEAGRETSF